MSIRCWIDSARRRCTELLPTSRSYPDAVAAAAVLAIGLAGGSMPSVLAQEQSAPSETGEVQLYRVEIVIFEQQPAPGRPEDPGRPPLPPPTEDLQGNIPGVFVEQARPLPQSGAAQDGSHSEPPTQEDEPEPLPFEPAELQDLTDVVRKLERRPEYRVLAQEAWRQPGFPEAQAVPVDLEMVERVRQVIAESGAGIAGYPSAELQVGSDAGERGDQPERSLKATATLWLGRYLHLRIEAESNTDMGIGHLNESRRMRSGEIHYFDSPRLGAIAVVVPEQNPLAPPDTPVPEDASPPATGGSSP